MPRAILISLAATWVSQWALWLIFANNAGFREMIAGGAAATLATWFVRMFVLRTGDCFQVRFRHAVQLVHVPAVLVSGTLTVFALIARRLRGAAVRDEIAIVPFRAPGSSPDEKARRALAIAFFTATPNALVLGILPEENILFFHRLEAEPVPRFLEVFGAQLGDKA